MDGRERGRKEGNKSGIGKRESFWMHVSFAIKLTGKLYIHKICRSFEPEPTSDENLIK